MSDVALVAHQVKYEQKSYWRNPGASVFTFVFPIMLLVVFGSINTGERVRFLGGIRYNQVFVPGIIAFGLIQTCFTGLTITLCLRRDNGILKRKRGTPLPAWALIAGLIGNALVVGTLLTALVMAVSILFYDVTFRWAHLGTLLLVLVVGAATFSVLAAGLSSLIPNADAAPAMTNLAIFPLLFVSGVFFPVNPSSVLAKIAGVFPVRHFVDGVFATFDPRRRGAALPASDLLVLVLWAVVGAVVATRRFRWVPRGR